MTKEQQNVARFMRFFGQNIPERPTPLDEETSILRAKLTLEEAFEKITKGLGLTVTIVDDFGGEAKVSEAGLKQISFQFKKEKETDLVELADGISDINFVNLGDACAAGIDMEPIDAEVARSNESKAWSSGDLEEGLPSLEPGHTICELEAGSGIFRIKRSDGKVVKSPSYSPANVAGELENQGWNK
jgi:predicted HAD superfamily Cof-like phosphohydrolase